MITFERISHYKKDHFYIILYKRAVMKKVFGIFFGIAIFTTATAMKLSHEQDKEAQQAYCTSFELSIASGNIDAIKQALQNTEMLTSLEPSTHGTFLGYAAWCGQEEIFEEILKNECIQASLKNDAASYFALLGIVASSEQYSGCCPKFFDAITQQPSAQQINPQDFDRLLTMAVHNLSIDIVKKILNSAAFCQILTNAGIADMFHHCFVSKGFPESHRKIFAMLLCNQRIRDAIKRNQKVHEMVVKINTTYNRHVWFVD